MKSLFNIFYIFGYFPYRAFVTCTTTVPFNGSAAIGFNIVFFHLVVEKPANLIACYGVAKILEAPKKVNYALWAMETTRVSFCKKRAEFTLLTKQVCR